MNPSSAGRGGLILMLITILVWAGSWIAMKSVVPYIGPFDFAALRYLGGAAVLFMVAVALRRPLGVPWWLTVLVGVTQNAAFQGLVQLGLAQGGVGQVALTTYTMPFWVVLLGWWLLGDKPSPRHWAGIALAALGLLWFVAPWKGLDAGLLPIAMGTGAGFFWALGTVLAKRTFDRHAPDVLVFAAWQMLSGGLALLPAALLVPQKAVQWNGTLITGMLYIILIATALGYLLWMLVIRRVPASIAGLSGLGVPVVAVLMAWGFLGEVPTMDEGIAMALILSGLWVVSRAARRPADPGDTVAR
ncbi:DMT family transporter [Bordetella genomosp. 13]|uniref:DMT family transporter n=1 Tax=Bordetella genomosp. 13 TaxID=463040 RepID=UPI00119DDF80|nr:EamA family transporter [Bordetella genomosp. 13]